MNKIFNFDNIGGKIKNLAKWSCWITILLIWIAAPIAFIALLADYWTAELCWIPLVGAIIGPFFVWVSSWAMYAFGEFVEDIHAIRNKEETPVDQKAGQEKNEPQKTLRNIAPLKVSPTTPQHHCECGETFYGLYCPICGAKAKTETKTENKPIIKAPSSEQSKSKNSLHHCKCGKDFYGYVCDNCGRTLKDL